MHLLLERILQDAELCIEVEVLDQLQQEVLELLMTDENILLLEATCNWVVLRLLVLKVAGKHQGKLTTTRII